MKIESCYIHIPFCRNICSYCDFCKVYYNKKLVKEYLKSLENEIDKYYKNDLFKTLYIGGGTPSCLDNEELKILFKIINKLKLDKELEFTFECNINDITEDLLLFLKKSRVNRLSIGVESFNETILNVLGRSNSGTINRLGLCKKYFDNINIDLIYGINGQSINDLEKDLEMIKNLDLNHISIYSLILEENTVLKINDYKEQDEDLTREMYDLICNFLKENGFIHYEISNFAKKGYESKHNLVYWNNNKYYGFGAGASGYIDNIRYTNTRSITHYIKGNYRYGEEVINKKTDMENFMILGLRKLSGVNNSDFKKRYGKDIKDVFSVKRLEKNKDNYYIREDNLFISNSILLDFIIVE